MSKKKRKRDCSSSDSSEEDEQRKKLKKKKKKKKKKRRRSTSSSEDSEMSSASSGNPSDDARRRKKRKKKRKKEKKKSKGEKRKSDECQPKAEKKKPEGKPGGAEPAPILIGPALPGSGGPIGPDIPAEILAVVKQEEAEGRRMAPMTKEEWEKRQSVVRRVYDEATGRHRLIKGDGEVLEEIVSRDRHMEINRQATLGDGMYFQSKLPNR